MSLLLLYDASGVTDTTPPLVSITSGPTRSRISRVVGIDSTDVQFVANEDVQAWQIRVVPSSGSPSTAGTLIESGGALSSGASQSSNITDDELIAASGGEGTFIVKVFAQDLAGNWSA